LEHLLRNQTKETQMKVDTSIPCAAALAVFALAFGVAIGGPPPQEDPHPGVVVAINCPPLIPDTAGIDAPSC
jgi:hypothetical protein